MTAQAATLDHVATETQQSRQRPGIGSLVRMEFLTTSKRRMTRIVFGLLAFAIGGLLGIAYAIERFASDLTLDVQSYLLPNAIEDGFAILSVLGPILIIILAALMTGSDYGWGTIRTIVGSGVSRVRLLSAKFLTMSLTAVALTVVGFLSAVVASIVIGLIEGQGIPTGWIEASTLGDLGLMLLRSSFLMIFFGTIGFVLAQVTRSVAAGIAAGIGLLVVGPITLILTGTLGSFGDSIHQFLITANTQVLNQMNTFGVYQAAPGDPSAWQSVGTLTLYAGIALIASLALFRRRDIAVD